MELLQTKIPAKLNDSEKYERSAEYLSPSLCTLREDFEFLEEFLWRKNIFLEGTLWFPLFFHTCLVDREIVSGT